MAEKEKELRKMSRTELIEIIYALKTSEDDLNKKNETLTAQLKQHKIEIEEAGSIAEAAIKLNDVFGVAQSAADDYLNSIKDVNDKAKQILLKANEEADALKKQTEEECRLMKEQTQEEISKRWEEFEHKVNEYLGKYQELSILLEHFGGVS